MLLDKDTTNLYITGLISESINEEYKDGQMITLRYAYKVLMPNGPDNFGEHYLIRTPTGMHFRARIEDRLP